MGHANIEKIVNYSRLVSVGGRFIGDYEWAQMEVWYSPDEEKYFWYSDHGNSTRSFGDYVENVWDFSNGSKDDALRAVRRFGDSRGRYEYGAKDQVAGLWKQVWDFRPEDAVFTSKEPTVLRPGESFDYGVTYTGQGSSYTLWGFSEDILETVVMQHGKVLLKDDDYIETSIDSVVRRVLGVPETVWGKP